MFSSTGSHLWVTFSQPGVCSSIVLQPGSISWLRSVPPQLSGEFALEHDAGVWRCVCQLLHIYPATVDDSAEAANSPGGLGLRSAERFRHAAHWASWADMLKALSSRVPSVAANFTAALDAREAQSVLSCVDFVVPAWEVVVAKLTS